MAVDDKTLCSDFSCSGISEDLRPMFQQDHRVDIFSVEHGDYEIAMFVDNRYKHVAHVLPLCFSEAHPIQPGRE